MTAPFALATDTAVRNVEVGAYRIATDAPESGRHDRLGLDDHRGRRGRGRDARGLGYAYADAAAAHLIRDTLAGVVEGRDALAVPGIWQAMAQAVRNVGRPGIASSAIAALDVALWDLKARLLGVSLAALLGPVRDGVAIYSSGGFTSYATGDCRSSIPRRCASVSVNTRPIAAGGRICRRRRSARRSGGCARRLRAAPSDEILKSGCAGTPRHDGSR